MESNKNSQILVGISNEQRVLRYSAESISTYGELKAALENDNVNLNGMKAVEGYSKTELLSEDSVIPIATGKRYAAVVQVLPVKNLIKNGIDPIIRGRILHILDKVERLLDSCSDNLIDGEVTKNCYEAEMAESGADFSFIDDNEDEE